MYDDMVVELGEYKTRRIWNSGKNQSDPFEAANVRLLVCANAGVTMTYGGVCCLLEWMSLD